MTEPPKVPPPPDQRFETAYRAKKGLLDRAAQDLDEALKHLITDLSGTSEPGTFRALHPLVRVKESRSVIRKAKQNGIEPIEGLEQFDDLVGARVVCEGLSDVQRLIDALQGLPRLEVIAIDPASRLQVGDESGYRARHVIVRFEVPEGFSLVKITVEIQVRTIIQDAWSRTSRHDFYASAEGQDSPDWVKSMFVALSHRGFELDRELQSVRDVVANQYAATARMLHQRVSTQVAKGHVTDAVGAIGESLSNADLSMQLAAVDSLVGTPEIWEEAATTLCPTLKVAEPQARDRFLDNLNSVDTDGLRKLSPLLDAASGI